MNIDRLPDLSIAAGNAGGCEGPGGCTDKPKQPAQQAPGSSGDRVDISSEARQAALESKQAQEKGDAKVRADKVEAARRFLEAGLYNDQGVVDRTAENLSSYLKLDA
ncbi:MAG: flagellar biosynthesis anti-sigma factor FlgM [Planctomycetota bacterium]|nr:flagellar biosynthesis anti-sigma factor FlgM [Planctomycetota bacterium]